MHYEKALNILVAVIVAVNVTECVSMDKFLRCQFD